MRIVYYVVRGVEFAGGSMDFLFDNHQPHIIHELRQSGHDVIHVNPVALLNRFGTPAEYGQALVDEVARLESDGKIDLFISTGIDTTLDPDAVRTLRGRGIVTINLGMDDLSHPYRVKNITPAFDAVWTTTREHAHVIRAYGAEKLYVMPFAANPHFFKPTQSPEDLSVYFIGTCYSARARTVATLAQAQVPIKVYGRSAAELYQSAGGGTPLTRALRNYKLGWERVMETLPYAVGRTCIYAALVRSLQDTIRKPPEHAPSLGTIDYLPGPSFEDMVDALSRAGLSLGSMELASTFVLKNPVFVIRWREFEAPMCGALHITNRFPELLEYFEEDREMLYYGSLEELIDKARHWLAPEREAARREIRIAARRRAEAEHTWTRRLQAIGDDLGLRF